MNYSRNLMPTENEIKRVSNELKLYGKAFFKNFHIVKSHGDWLTALGISICADNVKELLFDLNDTQRSIDFDNWILN